LTGSAATPSTWPRCSGPAGAASASGSATPRAGGGGSPCWTSSCSGGWTGGRGPRPRFGWAWQRLNASGGAAPIGELAREVGWSHKHLIARFRQQVGVAPKTAARLLRFNGVWRHLDTGRPLDWGLVAAETGYADQAHLIREFRQFTGTTPTGFQSQVNSVQDAAAAAS
jgi:AraC-like DNA-binding protein